MISAIALANMVLSHLGVGRTISDLESDQSEDADAINAFWDVTLADHFRAFPWSFARRIVAAAFVGEDPNDEWSFSHRYPSDCAFIRRVVTGNRVASKGSRVPHWIGGDSSGRLIFSDVEDLTVEYTALIEDESRWPSDFAMSFTLLLAYYVAPRLMSGSQAEIQRAQRGLLERYAMEVERARANSANEETTDPAGDSEFITERNS